MDQLHDAYDEVYAYTMGRGPSFILQHVVDAFGAQAATANTKPIGLTFSLVGLYLHVEKRFSGRQVQLVHMQLGKRKRRWPAIPLPVDRGSITVVEVLAAPPGAERDAAIDAWCGSVWEAFRESRQAIIDLLREYDIA
jgi:hypothetical protein